MPWRSWWLSIKRKLFDCGCRKRASWGKWHWLCICERQFRWRRSHNNCSFGAESTVRTRVFRQAASAKWAVRANAVYIYVGMPLLLCFQEKNLHIKNFNGGILALGTSPPPAEVSQALQAPNAEKVSKSLQKSGDSPKHSRDTFRLPRLSVRLFGVPGRRLRETFSRLFWHCGPGGPERPL